MIRITVLRDNNDTLILRSVQIKYARRTVRSWRLAIINVTRAAKWAENFFFVSTYIQKCTRVLGHYIFIRAIFFRSLHDWFSHTFIRTALGMKPMKRMEKNGKLSVALYNPRDTLTCLAVSFVDDNAAYVIIDWNWQSMNARNNAVKLQNNVYECYFLSKPN